MRDRRSFTLNGIKSQSLRFKRDATENMYIFIAIALDESIFLGVLHFPMKNIKSRGIEATPMDEATSNPASDVVCLLLLL